MARLKNKPGFWLDGKGLAKAVSKAKIPALEKAALLLEREVKTSMSTGGGSERTPSQPGGIPHVQTGNLRASISSAQLNADTFVVGPTKSAAYGKYLEFGTGRMNPRPFMFPALLKVIPKFPKLFENLDLKKFYKAQKRIKRVSVA